MVTLRASAVTSGTRRNGLQRNLSCMVHGASTSKCLQWPSGTGRDHMLATMIIMIYDSWPALGSVLPCPLCLCQDIYTDGHSSGCHMESLVSGWHGVRCVSLSLTLLFHCIVYHYLWIIFLYPVFLGWQAFKLGFTFKTPRRMAYVCDLW